MNTVFLAPNRVITGRGCLNAVGEEAARLGRKALIVTGRTFARTSGLAARVQSLLEAADVAWEIYDQVTPDPTLDQVDAARDLVTGRNCTVVIGLGGGSAIDAGKVAAALAGETDPARAFQQGQPVERPGVRFIAVPTTAGTGAEATPNGVITDPDGPVKKSIRGPSFMPAVAIVDPETTVHADLTVTAHAGMDALCQAVESHVSRHATPLTRALSRQAFALLVRALPRLASDLTDMNAREDAALGSLMAGMALANARLGVVHGLAHPLGARYGIPHGLVCGVLLPYAIRYNADAAAAGFAELSAVAGGPLVEVVQGLLTTLGLPHDLKALTIPTADVPALAAESKDSGSTRANPREASEADLAALVEAVR